MFEGIFGRKSPVDPTEVAEEAGKVSGEEIAGIPVASKEPKGAERLAQEAEAAKTIADNDDDEIPVEQDPAPNDA